MTGRTFERYRFTHPDGSAKDWAYAATGAGLYEVRWGKADRLAQRQTGLSRATVDRREVEKLNKGYRYIGPCAIDSDGRVGSLPRPPQAPAAPPPPPQPKRAPVDIAALLGGPEDGFYF